jgi:hypothetical protein
MRRGSGHRRRLSATSSSAPRFMPPPRRDDEDRVKRRTENDLVSSSRRESTAHFTIRTSEPDSCMTFVLTEPSTSRSTVPSERAPITISSASNCFAAFRSPGNPWALALAREWARSASQPVVCPGPRMLAE